MREIWNEGRVVGLSAYEIYVRHTLSEFPDQPVMSEREWLASSLGTGVSMILKIAKGTSAGAHDYTVPSNSYLCACTGMITASLFNGTVSLDSTGTWGTKVTSYGPLNKDVDSSSSVPTESELNSWDNQNLHMLREYTKLIDGVVFQPRYSSPVPISGTYKPDLTKPSKLRIRLSKAITEDLYVLLTGFLHKPIVYGLSKFDSDPLKSENPENGDFLGLEVFPWSTKIIFTVPSEVYRLMSFRSYRRRFTSSEAEKDVSSRGVVDFESNDPNSYYNTKYTDSRLPVNVTDMNVMNDAGVSVLGTYQRSADYPPALFGAKLTSIGLSNMSPIDIVAPGSVKVFSDEDLALNYPKVVPNVYSVLSKESGDIYIIDKAEAEKISKGEKQLVPITTKVTVENLGTASSPKYAADVIARHTDGTKSRTVKAISLCDASDNPLNTSGSAGDITGVDKIDWTTLLQGLGTNKKIDLLGQDIRNIKADSTQNGGVEIVSRKPVQSSQYVAFKTNTGNILRLYIGSGSINNAPTSGVPIGSIGIGWTD